MGSPRWLSPTGRARATPWLKRSSRKRPTSLVEVLPCWSMRWRLRPWSSEGIYGYANDLLAEGTERALLAEAHPQLVARCQVLPAELAELLGSYASCCVALRSVVDRQRDVRYGSQSAPVAG